jgi:sterol desaturase/sphingolipid hydroxylase (fatty acid hydroxylase superfamily)
MSYENIMYMFAIHMTTYWFFSIMFYFLDLVYLDKDHKNWKNYGKGARISFMNQMLITLPVGLLLNDKINNAITSSENDSYLYAMVKIFIIANFANIFFYIAHYLLHTKYLYKTIHHIHHQFIDPVVVGALYAHPIEHLFGNLLSFIVPLVVIGADFYTTMFMVFAATILTLTAHCDYKFIGKNAHVAHHRKFLCNYGFGDYLDKLLGTYNE